MTVTRFFKYQLTLEYDGSGYRGWQIQENARSVQGTLLTAATELFGAEVDIQGAGRTDAGVHALGQVAHLTVKKALPPPRIKAGLNDLLPAGLNILRVEQVPGAWHARHDAVSRSYIYIVSRTRTAFGKRYVWWVKDPLDAEKMKEACRLFAGFHDFASFVDRRLGDVDHDDVNARHGASLCNAIAHGAGADDADGADVHFLCSEDVRMKGGEPPWGVDRPMVTGAARPPAILE